MNTTATRPKPPDVLSPRRRQPRRRAVRLLSVMLVVVVLASLALGASIALRLAQSRSSPVISTNGPTVAPSSVVTQSLFPSIQIAHQVFQMISHMTLQEELGQLIVVGFNGTTLTPDLQKMIVNQHAGGIMLYAYNITGYAQTQTMDAAAQALAKIPLFVATDQEGGLVNRLESVIGPQPSALDVGNTNDPQQAYKWGVQNGKLLLQMGINLDLAPVVDVHSAPQTILITRMFGTTPEKVTVFAGQYLDGLQSQGVIGCLKHWPGLGASPVDPHDALPVLNFSQQELNDVEFAPYRNLIAQGDVNMIMSTHILLPAYDKQMPSSLSPILINQVLRQDLGYQGVVITDGLYMGALARWTIAQAAVLAIQAGNDIVLGSYDSYTTQQVLDALQAAVESGQLSKARIDLSVARVLTLKIKEGLIKAAPEDAP
jgi:beta-N-acetylhexosaminidase